MAVRGERGKDVHFWHRLRGRESVANFGAGNLDGNLDASIKFQTRLFCIPWPKSLAKKLGMLGLFLGTWIAVCHLAPKGLLITAECLLLGISHSAYPFYYIRASTFLPMYSCSSRALLL